MKIKFNNLKYQNDAVDSSVDLFKGQEIKDSQFTISLNSGFQGSEFTDDGIGIANKQTISNDKILTNLKAVQFKNHLTQSEELYGNNKMCPQFNIEMETGTGKTYVYLKTILELNKQYGFKKFIIVVPSIAIKEGVLKSLEITQHTLLNEYNRPIYDWFGYDSNHLDQVRDFASSDNIKIMIITMSSFNKEAGDKTDSKGNYNVIYRQNDVLSGQRPIDLISETRPILIIDEPQAVDNTDKAKRSLSNLKPLVAYRYSATHKDKSYPTIYRLDAVAAYKQQLVKQIEVSSLDIDEDGNRDYIRLKEVKSNKSGISASVEVYKKTKEDADKKIIKIKQHDNMFSKTKLPVYQKLGDVQDIDATPGQEKVYFSGKSDPLTLASSTQEDLDDKRFQIKKLIEVHLDKELKFKGKGIKVLSLIFLDHVKNYRTYNDDGSYSLGRYASIFEKEYSKIIKLPKYKELNDAKVPVSEVHDGYFAMDKKNHYKDTRGDSQDDESTYNVIMRDKEQLLTMYNPEKLNVSKANKIRFIFSHSALKEGWDNPNIFQIATLVDTKDPITKRQKIGRGLRIAVNQNGERIPGFNVNTLTVIANESYKSFADGLQKEYEEDGFKFGIFDDETFATIVISNNEDSPLTFGVKNSKKLIHEMKGNNYISSNGKATEKLKNAIESQQIELSKDFSEYKDDILDISEHKITNIKIRDVRERVQVKVNKEALDSNFLKLWNKIKFKTTYHIEFDSKKLINGAAFGIKGLSGLNKIIVKNGSYRSETGKLRLEDGGIGTSQTEIDNNFISENDVQYELPDIITYLQNETRLTRKTIVRILLTSNNLEKFEINPISYMTQAAQIINAIKEQLMVDGIKYEKNNETYDQSLFTTENLDAYLENSVKVNNKDKSIYNYIVTDSAIEKDFATKLDLDSSIRFYIKMPNWFRVPTPLGDYNPDWAIFRENEDGNEQKLYFIVDTKGNSSSDQLRPHEAGKLKSGEKHFKSLDTGITFRVIKDENEL